VMEGDMVGSWLLDGLDSSVMVALARAMAERSHTFAGGLSGVPDLAFTKDVEESMGIAPDRRLTP